MTRTAATAPAPSRPTTLLLVTLVAVAIAAALLEPVIGSLASTTLSWAGFGGAAAAGLVAVLRFRTARR